MDRHRGVEVILRGAHLHRDREALDDLRRVRAEHVGAENAAARTVDDQLDQGALLVVRQRQLERPEAAPVDVDVAVLGPGLLLGQADSAQGRLAENGGGDGFVVHRGRFAPIQGPAQAHRLVDRDRGQVQTVRHVADRPDVRHVAARVLVDEDFAQLAPRHAAVLQSQVGDQRPPAGGGENLAAIDLVAAIEVEPQPIVAGAGSFLDRLHPAVEAELDAARPHLLGEVGADLLVESAQEQRSPVDQRHVATEAGEDARELDADVTAADDREALRQALQEERLVRANRVLDPRNPRHVRPTADRDQNLVRSDSPQVARPSFDRYRVRIEQPRPPLEQFHAGAVQQAAVDPVQALDLAILVRDQPAPVEGGLLRRPTETRSLAVVVREGRGADEELLRHATDVDAGAAKVPLRGHRHPCAMTGGHPAGAHAAGAGADHEEVVVVVRHGRNARPIGRGIATRP